LKFAPLALPHVKKSSMRKSQNSMSKLAVIHDASNDAARDFAIIS
jgi:hypothetical protein